MADETKGEQQAGDGQDGAGADQPKDKKPGKKADKAETVAGEPKSCETRPTAEEMFGRLMVAVAGRPLSVHQPAKEIGDTTERLTADWQARKDKFAAKQRQADLKAQGSVPIRAAPLPGPLLRWFNTKLVSDEVFHHLVLPLHNRDQQAGELECQKHYDFWVQF